MSNINIEKVYVAHVKKGYETRKISIDSQMQKHNITFEYMLDGDMYDLSPTRLEQYFKGHLKYVTPQTSCMMKHLLICEDMVTNNIKEALVFEDDIILADNFIDIFNETMVEINNRDDINIIKTLISYENSTLKIVPKSELKTGEHLYLRDAGRCAGAYYLPLNLAKLIIQKCQKEKTNEMMDWYHNQLSDEGLMDIYWCYPTIAEQGSQNGIFDSGLDTRKKGTWIRRFKWKVKQIFKGA